MKKVADYIDGCFVEIYERAVKDEEASEKAGHPVFVSIPYVKIKPTNSKDIFDQPLNDEKKRRYADLFAKFESGEEVTMSGWLIQEWAQLDATQVETLKSSGIFTVEALAEMPESGMHRLPSGYITLKERAQEALSDRNSGEQVRIEVAQMRESVDDRFAAIRVELDAMTEELGEGKAVSDAISELKKEIQGLKISVGKLKSAAKPKGEPA